MKLNEFLGITVNPSDLILKAVRVYDISRFKEAYSKDFLLKGICTEEEYDSIPASEEEEKEARRLEGLSLIGDLFVGDLLVG